MEGGSDTTASFLQIFVLLLTAFPRVQEKLQEEIDRVVGQTALPVLDDFRNLPYLQVPILFDCECSCSLTSRRRLSSKKPIDSDLSSHSSHMLQQRMKVYVLLSLLSRSHEQVLCAVRWISDSEELHHTREHLLVLTPCWRVHALTISGGILHDPEIFDDPESFIPERYLESEFGAKEGLNDDCLRSTITFGYGRVRSTRPILAC
jgi:hypothetical protein